MFVLLKHTNNYKGILVISHIEGNFFQKNMNITNELLKHYYIYHHYSNWTPNPTLSFKPCVYYTEDIFNNMKYIISDEVKFGDEDLKLIDDKAKKIISDFKSKLGSTNNLNKEVLEPIINELIKKHETNFKGVGQPLRVVLTGSKFGPGLYDIIISLGKEEVEKRLINKIIT